MHWKYASLLHSMAARGSFSIVPECFVIFAFLFASAKSECLLTFRTLSRAWDFAVLCSFVRSFRSLRFSHFRFKVFLCFRKKAANITVHVNFHFLTGRKFPIDKNSERTSASIGALKRQSMWLLRLRDLSYFLATCRHAVLSNEQLTEHLKV